MSYIYEHCVNRGLGFVDNVIVKNVFVPFLLCTVNYIVFGAQQ